MNRNGMNNMVRVGSLGLLVVFPAHGVLAQSWNQCSGSLCTSATTVSVGVDTSTPLAPLHIQTAAATKAKELLRLDNTSSDVVGNGSSIFFGQNGAQYGRIANFYTADTNWILTLGHNGSSDDLVINRFGNIGVGTTNPQVPLHLQTSAAAKAKELLRLDNSIAGDAVNNGTSIFFGQNGAQYGRIANFYTVETDWIFTLGHNGSSDDLVINRFGNVGVGTINPQVPLHLQTSAAAKAKELLRLDNTMADAVNNGTSIFFGQNGSQYGRIANYYTTASNWILSLGHNGTADDLVITQSGRVGIATSTPAYSLDVNGTIHGTNVMATYQDVAEWVPASEPMSAGTVVVVDSQARNGVAPSRRAYDTAVAGVVSERPGISLGVAAESKAQIATTGRVKVHVDASGGAIHAGDLLVTSDRVGVAMRSNPVNVSGVKMHRPGTLIGKALEPLERGEGEILVLLSLQ